MERLQNKWLFLQKPIYSYLNVWTPRNGYGTRELISSTSMHSSRMRSTHLLTTSCSNVHNLGGGIYLLKGSVSLDGWSVSWVVLRPGGGLPPGLVCLPMVLWECTPRGQNDRRLWKHYLPILSIRAVITHTANSYVLCYVYCPWILHYITNVRDTTTVPWHI